MPQYQYTGDAPTVFIHLIDENGHTWVPSKGDVISTDEEISHPLLDLVQNAKPTSPPASNAKSPETADEQQEN